MRPSSRAEVGGTLVSVIVPVFNTRPDLVERAVASALRQTHPYLELLVIDDGSAAETAAFLDRMALRDPRIRVIHRENGGVSMARNAGVKNAQGDFIAYLDADDYLESRYLATALETARRTDAEVVFGGIQVVHSGGDAFWRADGPPSHDPLIGTPELLTIACVHALSGSPSPRQPSAVLSVTNVVAALYAAGVARRHQFPEGVSQAEDRLYNLQILLDAPRTAFCSDLWYVYDQRNDEGATRRATSRTIEGIARTVLEFAAVGDMLTGHTGLASDAGDRIGQAAAEGALKYLKVLTGMMAVAGDRRANRRLLSTILRESAVRDAVARAARTGWQDRLFVAAASGKRARLLLAVGWIWVRRGGLGMIRTPQRAGDRP